MFLFYCEPYTRLVSHQRLDNKLVGKIQRQKSGNKRKIIQNWFQDRFNSRDSKHLLGT